MTPPLLVRHSAHHESGQSVLSHPSADHLGPAEVHDRLHEGRTAAEPRYTPCHIEDLYRSERMQPADFEKLVEDLEEEIRRGASSVAILGLTPVTLRLLETLTSSGAVSALRAIYTPQAQRHSPVCPVAVRELSRLQDGDHDVLVVAADARKEDLIRAALPFIRNTPRLILAGYAHLRFRDPLFDEIVSGVACSLPGERLPPHVDPLVRMLE